MTVTLSVCVMLGEIPRWRCAQWDWLLSLRLSMLPDSFLFRKRLRPSHFLFSSSQGPVRNKQLGRGFQAWPCAPPKPPPRPSWQSMSSMVVLERHLWLTMTELKEADKVPFLDAPVSSNSHFEPAVEGFAECFTEAPKSSQAMRHFLPKRTSSSAASSRPKPAPTQQPAKPMPATPEPRSHKDRQDRGPSRSAGRYPFPKRQEPRPKIALDPAPQKSSWSARQKEEGLLVPHGPTLVPGRPTAVIADKIKHINLKKESKYPLLPTISVLPLCSHSLELFQPLATWAEAWRAIPGVSEWVMATIRWGYTLQFARRPPRFRGVLATIVHSKDAQVLHAEVINLLEKEAIEIVPPAQSKSGFYSLYFLIPQKRRWPATYSRFLAGSHIILQPKTGCPLKLSRVEPGQYLDGRHSEKTRLLLDEGVSEASRGCSPYGLCGS